MTPSGIPPINILAFRFTVWSRVDITLRQQQCVVTHLVTRTRKVRIGSFAWERESWAVCFSQLCATQYHAKCQEWPNRHKLEGEKNPQSRIRRCDTPSTYRAASHFPSEANDPKKTQKKTILFSHCPAVEGEQADSKRSLKILSLLTSSGLSAHLAAVAFRWTAGCCDITGWVWLQVHTSHNSCEWSRVCSEVKPTVNFNRRELQITVLILMLNCFLKGGSAEFVGTC